MAAKNGCNEAAKLLLSHGAFIEAKANVIVFSFLCFICYNYCYVLIPRLDMSKSMLIQNGMTPLHLAVWHSLRSDDCLTVKTLLEYNADCSAKDDVSLLNDVL